MTTTLTSATMVRSCPDSSGHVGSGLAGLGCQDSQLEWFELQIMQGYRAGGQWRCSCRIRFRGSEASFCVGRLQETQSLRQLCENSSGEVSRQAACGEHCLFCSLPLPLSLSLYLSLLFFLCVSVLHLRPSNFPVTCWEVVCRAASTAGSRL